MAYTQEFLVNVFLHRYRSLSQDKIDNLRNLANKCFLESGRDKFRVYACVTPEAVRNYVSFCRENP
jgi:hypothetical protein